MALVFNWALSEAQWGLEQVNSFTDLLYSMESGSVPLPPTGGFVDSPLGPLTAMYTRANGDTQALVNPIRAPCDTPVGNNFIADGPYSLTFLFRLDLEIGDSSRNSGDGINQAATWGYFTGSIFSTGTNLWFRSNDTAPGGARSIQFVTRQGTGASNQTSIFTPADSYSLGEWIAIGVTDARAAGGTTLTVVRESDQANPIRVTSGGTSVNTVYGTGFNTVLLPGGELSNALGEFAGAVALSKGWDEILDEAAMVAELQSYFTPAPTATLTVSTEDGLLVEEGGSVLVQRDGGTLVTVNTNGTVGFKARLKASINGIECFAGTAGQGSIIVPANTLDESRVVTDQGISFVTPPLPLGTYDIVLTDDSGNPVKTVGGAITAVAQNFRSAVYSLRSNLSRRWDTGYKSPTIEEYPQ